MLPIVPPQIAFPDVSAYTSLLRIESPAFALANTHTETRSVAIPDVPFYSQFTDITSPRWQKVGCGITSLAMLIEYYGADVTVDSLLKQGIAAGAYLESAGWTYNGLVSVAKKYGMNGSWYDYGKSSNATALAKIKNDLDTGPVIASVHYKFDPASTIPHLVVITAIDGETVHYNDPAAQSGDGTISLSKFTKAWKKRYIIVRPATASQTT